MRPRGGLALCAGRLTDKRGARALKVGWGAIELGTAEGVLDSLLARWSEGERSGRFVYCERGLEGDVELVKRGEVTQILSRSNHSFDEMVARDDEGVCAAHYVETIR